MQGVHKGRGDRKGLLGNGKVAEMLKIGVFGKEDCMATQIKEGSTGSQRNSGPVINLQSYLFHI